MLFSQRSIFKTDYRVQNVLVCNEIFLQRASTLTYYLYSSKRSTTKRATSKITQVLLQNGLVSKRASFKNCFEAQNIKKVMAGIELGSTGRDAGALSTEPSRQMVICKFLN